MTTGSSEALRRFAWAIVAVWRKWPDRRSQNAKTTWERMHRSLKRYSLPRPRITHPAPARS
ncbi:hypothetical protein [Sorangium sp. So ce1182]|uniref:hypothetical protein n=1 Tax=Sorangium sp. So ce1182 TaxID=3133334 RepID=UPI003F61C99B